jgi:membrane protein
LQVVRRALSDFAADEATTRSAALAYYTALSMAPLVVLLLWLTSFLGEDAQQGWIQEIQSLIGAKGGEAVSLVVTSAKERPELGNVAGFVSLATLVFAATAVFAELQTSLNRMWHVKAMPGQGLRGWFRKRVVSFGMLLSVFFLLIVSTALSAGLGILSEAAFGPRLSVLLELLHFTVSLAVFGVSFALLYRYLPDVEIRWRDVWAGGFVTALLFTVGKLGVGLYLGRASVGSAYGAAGSLIVLLMWSYYSALIFFLGAEVTRALAWNQGRALRPDEHAVPLQDLPGAQPA